MLALAVILVKRKAALNCFFYVSLGTDIDKQAGDSGKKQYTTGVGGVQPFDDTSIEKLFGILVCAVVEQCFGGFNQLLIVGLQFGGHKASGHLQLFSGGAIDFA
jgi:hypothetical protein